MSTEALVQVEQQGVTLLGQAQEIAVTDAPSFQHAGLFLRTIAGYVRKVGEVLDPIVEAAHKAHKVAVEQRKMLLQPAQDAEALVKKHMTGYEMAERERVRKEQEHAEKERRRIEDDVRLHEAARLYLAGKTAEAEKALTAPVSVPVFTPPVAQVEKVEGVSFRETWRYEITDAAMLPAAYLIPDEKKIAGVVRAMKGQTNIPGVRAYPDRTAAVRA